MTNTEIDTNTAEDFEALAINAERERRDTEDRLLLEACAAEEPTVTMTVWYSSTCPRARWQRLVVEVPDKGFDVEGTDLTREAMCDILDDHTFSACDTWVERGANVAPEDGFPTVVETAFTEEQIQLLVG